MTKLTEFLNGRTMAEFYDSGWGPTALELFARDLASEAAGAKYILDLGCGTGAVTRYAVDLAAPNSQIIWLDPTPILLNSARSN
jgi:ubiquinone/menaquinone biosynthesis C-methylase UbiE